MRKAQTKSKKASRGKAKNLNVRRATIRDLDTVDAKARKVRGGKIAPTDMRCY